MAAERAVSVRDSDTHGRGVFVNVSLMRGNMFTCPVVPFEGSVDDLPRSLRPYTFPWRGCGNMLCMPMGWAAFLNHSNDPCLELREVDYEAMEMTWVSNRVLFPGDELTIDYGTDEAARF